MSEKFSSPKHPFLEDNFPSPPARCSFWASRSVSQSVLLQEMVIFYTQMTPFYSISHSNYVQRGNGPSFPVEIGGKNEIVVNRNEENKISKNDRKDYLFTSRGIHRSRMIFNSSRSMLKPRSRRRFNRGP